MLQRSCNLGWIIQVGSGILHIAENRISSLPYVCVSEVIKHSACEAKQGCRPVTFQSANQKQLDQLYSNIFTTQPYLERCYEYETSVEV